MGRQIDSQNLTTVASSSKPSDVAIGPNGEIFVADRGNNRIAKIDNNSSVTSYRTA